MTRATYGRCLMGSFCLGVCMLGCGHAALRGGPRHRLEFQANPQLSVCDDRDAFRARLRPIVNDTIDPAAERVLRVSIDRQRNNEKRVLVELVDERGHVVDGVDQALRVHMDCERALNVAAGLASGMIEKTLPKQTASVRESSPPLPQKRKDWLDSNPEPDPEPLRPRPRFFVPDPEEDDVSLPNATAAPSQGSPPASAPAQTPGTVNNFYVGGEKPKEGPSADPMAGVYFLGGPGVLRGHDSRLNFGGRFGVGRLSESGAVAFEVDLTGAGSRKGVANHPDPALDFNSFLFALNLGACSRSSALGLCFLVSGLADGYDDSRPKLATGFAFGAGTRSWLDIFSGETWAVRANIEMIVPILVQSNGTEDPRIWEQWAPTGAVFITFAKTKKGEDKK